MLVKTSKEGDRHTYTRNYKISSNNYDFPAGALTARGERDGHIDGTNIDEKDMAAIMTG